MYFMVIRPQQKKGKEHQELLNKLKKKRRGDDLRVEFTVRWST